MRRRLKQPTFAHAGTLLEALSPYSNVPVRLTRNSTAAAPASAAQSPEEAALFDAVHSWLLGQPNQRSNTQSLNAAFRDFISTAAPALRASGPFSWRRFLEQFPETFVVTNIPNSSPAVHLQPPAGGGAPCGRENADPNAARYSSRTPQKSPAAGRSRPPAGAGCRGGGSSHTHDGDGDEPLGSPPSAAPARIRRVYLPPSPPPDRERALLDEVVKELAASNSGAIPEETVFHSRVFGRGQPGVGGGIFTWEQLALRFPSYLALCDESTGRTVVCLRNEGPAANAAAAGPPGGISPQPAQAARRRARRLPRRQQAPSTTPEGPQHCFPRAPAAAPSPARTPLSQRNWQPPPRHSPAPVPEASNNGQRRGLSAAASAAGAAGSSGQNLLEAALSCPGLASEGGVVLAIGPAGTGKTHAAVLTGAAALRSGSVAKLVVTRPTVTVGENLGFLPGDANAKLQPYLVPVMEMLRKVWVRLSRLALSPVVAVLCLSVLF